MEITKTHAVNVGSAERLISLAAGSFLLINTISAKKFSLLKLLTSGYLLYRGASGNCPLYTIAGRPAKIPSNNINIRVKMFVAKPRESVYRAWRNLENLPLFMSHITDVKQVFDNISEWKAELAGNPVPLKWRASIVRDIVDQEITWRSLPDSMIDNVGKVEFRDSEEAIGTDIYVTISYKPPLGIVGDAISSFFTPAIEKVVREDIYGFKQFIEANVNY
ncbi:MAG TPA: SRPBCC family protein [Flavitalea sp.]|nr:SRPBCC family protein [Flavitalea sp.]